MIGRNEVKINIDDTLHRICTSALVSTFESIELLKIVDSAIDRISDLKSAEVTFSMVKTMIRQHQNVITEIINSIRRDIASNDFSENERLLIDISKMHVSFSEGMMNEVNKKTEKYHFF